ncbi:MAG: hypothetical protein ACFFA6_00160 [Promethearchaeota archaeon]
MIQITDAVNEINSFMSNSTSVLFDLNNNIKNLQSLVISLFNLFDTILNKLNALNINKIHESFATGEAKILSSTRYENHLSNPIRSPFEQKSADSKHKINISGEYDFNLIMSAAKSNNPAVEIAMMLEKLRIKLQKENPLNPILFELSMESRRLQSLGNIPLNEHNLLILIEKIQKWIE